MIIIEDTQKVIALLEQKRNILKEIWNFSKDKAFKAEEKYVDAFDLYYAKRSEYFEVLGRIDESLNSDEAVKRQLAVKTAPIVALETEIKQISADILAIDKRNKKIMQDLNLLLGRSFRFFKEGQKANVQYTETSLPEGPPRFDSKL